MFDSCVLAGNRLGWKHFPLSSPENWTLMITRWTVTDQETMRQGRTVIPFIKWDQFYLSAWVSSFIASKTTRQAKSESLDGHTVSVPSSENPWLCSLIYVLLMMKPARNDVVKVQLQNMFWPSTIKKNHSPLIQPMVVPVLRKLFLFCFGFLGTNQRNIHTVYTNCLSYFVPDEPLCIDCISSEYMYRFKSVLFSCSMVSEFPRCLLSSTRSSNWFIMPNVKM